MVTHRSTTGGLPEEIPPPRGQGPQPAAPGDRRLPEIAAPRGRPPGVGIQTNDGKVFPPFFLGGFSHPDFFRKKKKTPPCDF